jgi:hypothetical protein
MTSVNLNKNSNKLLYNSNLDFLLLSQTQIHCIVNGEACRFLTQLRQESSINVGGAYRLILQNLLNMLAHGSQRSWVQVKTQIYYRGIKAFANTAGWMNDSWYIVSFFLVSWYASFQWEYDYNFSIENWMGEGISHIASKASAHYLFCHLGCSSCLVEKSWKLWSSVREGSTCLSHIHDLLLLLDL